MSFPLTGRVSQLRNVDAKKKLLLFCFADHHNHKLKDLVCWPNTQTQIEWTGIPQSTLYRTRAEMLRDGWIERLYSHPAAPKHVTEIYRLSPEHWPSQNGNTSQNEKCDSQFEKNPSQNGNAYKESEPVCEPVKEPAPARPARQADAAYEQFALEFKKHHAMSYMAKRGDFVQLANLRRCLGVDGRASLPDWDRAVSNYFVTPIGGYTLADLCTRYAVFRQHALDRYNRPIGDENHETASVHSSSPDRRQDDNLTAAHRLRARIAAGNSGGS